MQIKSTNDNANYTEEMKNYIILYGLYFQDSLSLSLSLRVSLNLRTGAFFETHTLSFNLQIMLS